MVNVENVLRVADAIEKHEIPWLGFNMRMVVGTASRERPDLSGNDCKTVACIAGWAFAIEQRLTSPKDWDLNFGSGTDWLGLTGAQALALFMPCGWHDDPTKFPPARAVAVLRHLAATGEVDWSMEAT